MARKTPEQNAQYEKLKERSRKRNAEASKSGRDIGDIPPVANPKRRKQTERNFCKFCETYFPWTFTLGWSDDHRKVIKKIETCVLDGGLFANAMPRGSGKTSLCEAATLFALLHGHRKFVVPLGSDAKSSEQMLDSIKTELEVNELLAEDFPEVCYPIALLEGIANRCAGQTHGGDRTHITWTNREVVLPTIAGSKASGGILRVAGLLGRIRGMKYKTADGISIRPDLVIPDDPQTDASAHSVTQCERREKILAGAVLGLAGPGKKIAGIMPCTVIRRGDMADRILDPTIHPEWNGERCKLLYKFPKNMALWDQYAEVLRESLRAGKGIAEATEFYRKHRKEMDEGAVIAWAERFNPDELSAIQHAMNLFILDEEAFFSEYQNEPQEEKTDLTVLTATQIAAKVSGIARHQVPLWATHVVAGIDVQAAALFYSIVALGDDFTGTVIDYDAWPPQGRRYYSLRDLKVTFANVCKATSTEGRIHEALNRLTDDLLAKDLKREDGALMPIELCLVDANWSTETVYEFCRRATFKQRILPSDGSYYGPNSMAIGDRKKKAGERLGLNWYIPVASGNRVVRKVVSDSNWWKSFLHERLAQAPTDRGSLTFFGSDERVHRLISEHLTAEYREKVKGKREIDEWKPRPGKPDNHFFDTLYLSLVAGSVQGCKLPELGGEAKRRGKRVSFSEMQSRAKSRVQASGPPEPIDSEPKPVETKPSAAPDSEPNPSPTSSPGKKRVSFAEMQRKARAAR